ncbi:MAG: phosphoribosylamine--glycine ligase [Planctomycetota bacterium]
MKVLVIGSGGREHALAWKARQSTQVTDLLIAPGNPGTASLGRNVPVAADDIDGLLALAKREQVDLTIVGPEQPLVAGIVDRFQADKLRIWGPSKAAAELEGSKVAMKEFLRRHAIPTAAFKVFSDAQQAHEYLDEIGAPVVVKCDGLAAGKGVTVATELDEAHSAVRRIMEEQVFGAQAGQSVVIEECMQGEEISIFAFCDGHNAVICDAAQDHKQAFDGDRGPNTGGMGAFTPAPGLLSQADEDAVVRKILLPTMTGLVKERRPYVGVLYLGLMLTDKGPRVVEYNVRFGDPECQPLMLRLQNDLIAVCEACIDGTLDQIELEWSDETAICVTMASEGYPGSYAKGRVITGLDELLAHNDDVAVFHAGTDQRGGQLVTAGGRVLSICALGADLEAARTAAYAACERIDFEGKHYRTDIGRRHG